MSSDKPNLAAARAARLMVDAGRAALARREAATTKKERAAAQLALDEALDGADEALGLIFPPKHPRIA